MRDMLLRLTLCMAICFNTTNADKRQMEPFVVNGDFARINDFPHCVFLYADCGSKWICGSSVLNQRILLTAAHCVNDCKGRWRIDAFAGHEDIKKVKTKRKVHKIYIHEKYDEKQIQNDLALILLEKNLPLSKDIRRVALIKQNNFGLQAAVAGWGLVNDRTREGTDLLKYAIQRVRSKETCGQLGKLLPGMMCAGSTNSEFARPSQGDSGSALVISNYIQIGVVSFRYPNLPGLVIYSNISYFYDWIESKTKALYCGRKY